MALVVKNSAGLIQLTQAQFDAISALPAGTSNADAFKKIFPGRGEAGKALTESGLVADHPLEISKFVVVNSTSVEDEDDGVLEFSKVNIEPALKGQLKLQITRVRPGSKKSASPIVVVEGASPDGENHAIGISQALADLLDLEEDQAYSFEMETRIAGKTTWISRDPEMRAKAQQALSLAEIPAECYVRHRSNISTAVRRVLGEVTEQQWKAACDAAQKTLQLQNSTNIAVSAVSQLMQMFMSTGMSPEAAAQAATNAVKITN